MKRFQQSIALTAVLLLGTTGAVPQALAASTNAQTSTQDAYLNLTPEQAEAHVGFSVKLPALPKGYHLDQLAYSSILKQVVASYGGVNLKPFYVEMRKGDITKEKEGLEQVSFQKGVAYQGHKKGYGDMNIFVWEQEKGVVYQLASGLPAAEVKKLAESVGTGGIQEELQQSFEYGTTLNGLSYEEAVKLLGSDFSLPQPMRSASDLMFAFHKTPKGDSVDAFMQNDEHDLTVMISKGSIATLPVGYYVINEKKEVQVGGKTAYAGTIPGWSFDDPDLTTFNVLLFESPNGLVYFLSSTHPTAELITLAETVN